MSSSITLLSPQIPLLVLLVFLVLIQTAFAGCGCPGCDYDDGSACARCCSSFIKRQLDDDRMDEPCYCGIGCLIGGHCPLCCRRGIAPIVGRQNRFEEDDVAEIVRLINNNRNPSFRMRQKPISDDNIRTV